MKYVGKTRNMIIDRFQGHMFDINTQVIQQWQDHFLSHNDHLDPKMTKHIFEYIKLTKDIPRSYSLREKTDLLWIHKLNT